MVTSIGHFSEREEYPDSAKAPEASTSGKGSSTSVKMRT
jgi:hypothetical protein